MDKESFVAEVYGRVPAYRKFLDGAGACPPVPWEKLPLTHKAGYLLAFPTEELCWDGSLDRCHLIGASSGFSRSGTIFWPKRPGDESRYVESVERALVDHYAVDRKRTLILVCLAFGTWIGGMQLATAVRTLAASGRHPVTCATPGLNLKEAVQICSRFGTRFERVIVLTNPSNVSLMAALLEREGVCAPPGTYFFGVVGEYFPEGFRESVASRFGHPPDSPFCVWTGYGSADAGDLGVETAATIALRKFFFHRPALSRERFGTEDTPMLLSPNPDALIEVVDGNLVVTKDQLVPLVRFDTGDAGTLIPREAFAGAGGVTGDLVASLPESVLAIFGRAGDAVIFYGTNLLVGEIGGHFLSLPEGLRYGGLFELRRAEKGGVTIFSFTVYVRGESQESLRTSYQEDLIRFLKERSLEFGAKYDALSRSVGEPLIRVELKDVALAPGGVKHRYIVEN